MYVCLKPSTVQALVHTHMDVLQTEKGFFASSFGSVVKMEDVFKTLVENE